MPVKRKDTTPVLEEMLCFALHSAGFAFNQIYRAPLKRLGVTYPQYLVLVALWTTDHVSVGRLGEQLALDTGTLTPLLKRLETMGLLTRRRSDVDERRVIIALTERGRTMKSKAADVTRCVVDGTGLSVTQLKRLNGEIHVLRTKLRDAVNQPSPRRQAGRSSAVTSDRNTPDREAQRTVRRSVVAGRPPAD